MERNIIIRILQNVVKIVKKLKNVSPIRFRYRMSKKMIKCIEFMK